MEVSILSSHLLRAEGSGSRSPCPILGDKVLHSPYTHSSDQGDPPEMRGLHEQTVLGRKRRGPVLKPWTGNWAGVVALGDWNFLGNKALQRKKMWGGPLERSFLHESK